MSSCAATMERLADVRSGPGTGCAGPARDSPDHAANRSERIPVLGLDYRHREERAFPDAASAGEVEGPIMIITQKTSSPANVLARRGHCAGAAVAGRDDPRVAGGPAHGRGSRAPAWIRVLHAGRERGQVAAQRRRRRLPAQRSAGSARAAQEKNSSCSAACLPIPTGRRPASTTARWRLS